MNEFYELYLQINNIDILYLSNTNTSNMCIPHFNLDAHYTKNNIDHGGLCILLKNGFEANLVITVFRVYCP